MNRFVTALLLFALAPGVASLAAPPALERFEFARLRMGTSVRIVLYAEDEASARRASAAAYARIDEIEQIMSHYRQDSEISRLSASSGRGPVRVTPELFKILKSAESFSKKTSGAVDITVGPLVELWRKARRGKQLPSRAELRAAISVVGYRNVVLDESKGLAELKRPGMKLDLSAIAKGYAADEALRVLKQNGCPRALVDAGGDIALGDGPPGKKGWSIAIDTVAGQPGSAARQINLANTGIATSGDAYQFVEIGGARYSHIVDPKTGLGVGTVASATVIARDCLTADALATALCVLPPNDGIRVVRSMDGSAARILYRRGDRIEQAATESFPP